MKNPFSTELRTEKVTSIVTYKTYKFLGFPFRVKIVSNDFKTEPITGTQ